MKLYAGKWATLSGIIVHHCTSAICQKYILDGTQWVEGRDMFGTFATILFAKVVEGLGLSTVRIHQ